MSKGVWLALLVLFVYLLSYAGIPHSIDELATLAVTESILHGSLQVNRMAWDQERDPPQNAYGLDGNLYSKKGLGESLVALPLFWAGKHWDAVGSIQLALLTNALIAALTVFFFHRLAAAWGYREPVATWGRCSWGWARCSGPIASSSSASRSPPAGCASLSGGWWPPSTAGLADGCG
jgi:hypothetical protein